MKYLQALAEKNLSVDDLSKKIKDKIALIEKTKNEEKASKLDTELEKLIQKFNLEAYREQLRRISELNKKKAEKTADSDVQKEENSADSDVQEFLNDDREFFEEAPVPEEKAEEIATEAEATEVEEDKKKLKKEKLSVLAKKLKELKEKTEINTEAKIESEPEPEPEFVEAEEIEDFKKENTTYRPKSQNLGLIIMGAGTFLFIWGMMMFANSKRQNR